MKKLLAILTVVTAANVWACDKDSKSSTPVVVAPSTGKTHQVITSEGSYLIMPSGSNTTYVIQTGKAKK